MRICISMFFLVMFSLVVCGKDFSGVKGGTSETQSFDSLNDNDIVGSAASGWQFLSATVSGGNGIKSAHVSSGKGSVYTQTTEDNDFNFLCFTLTLSGNITRNGPGPGQVPTYSLTAGRDGDLLITSSQGDTNSAVIPVGGSITFYGKEVFAGTTTPIRNKRCDWMLRGASGVSYNVGGNSYTPNPTYLLNSTSMSISPSSNYKTPDAGEYTVQAKPTPSAENQWESANLTVVDAEFTMPTNWDLGFDDYTNFNDKPRYPSRRNATVKCSKPYISCEQGGNIQAQPLTLFPTPIAKEISIISQSNMISTPVPNKLTSTGITSFSARGNGDINATLDNINLASIGIRTFTWMNKKCLIVLVGYPNGSGGYTYPSVHSSCSKITSTFKQCLINAVVYAPYSFPYPGHIPAPYKWTRQNRLLRQAYFEANFTGNIAQYDIIQFIINSSDQDPTATAWGECPGKFSWVYSSGSGGATSPHEIAHNFGADDSSDHNDVFNLLIPSGQYTKLREGQWQEIR